MIPTLPNSSALAYASAALCATIFIPLSFAADQNIECPAAISATSIKVTNIVDGWTPIVPSSLALTAAGFMQASPEKMAHLKPFSTREDKKRAYLTWKFEGDFPQGKWLTCDYAGGVVSISKEMARSTTECAVIYEKTNKDKPNFIRITCK